MPQKGKEIYLNPSGYTGTAPRGGEMGSNGLVLYMTGGWCFVSMATGEWQEWMRLSGSSNRNSLR